MKPELTPFKRQFTDADLSLFQELTEGLVGQTVTRYRPLYGGAFSVHFGAPIRSASGKERGAWIVTGWGCDLVVQTRQESTDSRIDGREPTRERLNTLVGLKLEIISLERESLSLLLQFESDTQISLISDPDFEGDSWMLSLPTHETLAASADGSWLLENDQAKLSAEGK